MTCVGVRGTRSIDGGTCPYSQNKKTTQRKRKGIRFLVGDHEPCRTPNCFRTDLMSRPVTLHPGAKVLVRGTGV